MSIQYTVLNHYYIYAILRWLNINRLNLISMIDFKTVIFEKHLVAIAKQQLRKNLPAIAVIKLTYYWLRCPFSNGVCRILEYFIFNNNNNNNFICSLAGIIIEVWTPIIDTGCGNLISLYVQLLVSLYFSRLDLKRKRKNFTPLFIKCWPE